MSALYAVLEYCYSGTNDNKWVKSDIMRQIVLLIYPGVTIGQLTGMAEVFRFANELARFLRPAAAPRYQLSYFQFSDSDSYRMDGVQIDCIKQLPEQIDALLIPGSYAHQASELAAQISYFRQHRAWFRQLERQGSVIASSCNGSFGLAATGLLDQQQATTCWFLAEFFQQQFPTVTLDATATVKRAGQCYTAGATSAYLSLCLALIQHFDGVRFAAQLAKVLLIEPALHGQAPFLSVDQLVHHDDARIAEVQLYLRNHLAEPLDLQQLAARFAMSSRTLIRRFKAATGETPMAWLQKLRIDKAKMLLESSNMSVEQLTKAIGYEDVSSFRKLFQQFTRLTPKAYRNQFSLNPD